MVFEFLATFYLVFGILGVAHNKKYNLFHISGVVFLAVTAGILATGPSTGGALNPARHFGPALV